MHRRQAPGRAAVLSRLRSLAVLALTHALLAPPSAAAQADVAALDAYFAQAQKASSAATSTC